MPPSLNPAMDTVDPFADRGRDLESRVELPSLAELNIEVLGELGKSATKRTISLTSGVSVNARNSTNATIATT